jgi:hypothetical protein
MVQTALLREGRHWPAACRRASAIIGQSIQFGNAGGDRDLPKAAALTMLFCARFLANEGSKRRAFGV